MSRKLHIKTFGCQMNEYDSARMADALAASHGLETTDDPAQADVLLLNTCSIREKAQEKVFSQLGLWRELKDARPGLVIGVGGCVASQEGAAIIRRAPYVDMVFGPQTLHRLPQMLDGVLANHKPAVDISFPEIEKFDRLPEPRVDGVRALVSIMEGCSKYCSFCVVPYTRGEEFSRPFDDVIAEVAHLAEHGVREVILLGQNVNAYRGAMHAGEFADLALLIRYLAEIDGIGPHPFHHLAPAGIQRAADRRLCRCAETRRSSASPGAERQRPHSRADEARSYRARIQIEDSQAARSASGHQRDARISSSVSRARPKRISPRA